MLKPYEEYSKAYEFVSMRRENGILELRLHTDDKTLRVFGLISIVVGLLALQWVHYLDWIPVRLLALSFSLTGNFVNSFNRYWSSIWVEVYHYTRDNFKYATPTK